MTRFTTLAAFAAAAALPAALAQGDPEVAEGRTLNQPTKTWEQWQPKPTYALEELPDQYMGADRIEGYSEPQTGFNQCAESGWSQESQCQTAWLNDINDWCIWGPPSPGEVGATERIAVAYCTTDQHGTRLIPDDTLTGVHFLRTPNYVQVTGRGDFTKIGIPEGDAGGEMDPHGQDDLGNPIGGVLFTTANPESNGEPWQALEWTNFMSYEMFCIRACWGPDADRYCEHIYDVLGCRWNMPSETGYDAGTFESCEGDNAPFAGIFDGSTFSQGDPVTPEAHPPAPSSNCQPTASLSHGLYAVEAPSETSDAAGNDSEDSSSSGGSSSGSSGSSSSSSGDNSNLNAENGAMGMLSSPTAAVATCFVAALAGLAVML